MPPVKNKPWKQNQNGRKWFAIIGLLLLLAKHLGNMEISCDGSLKTCHWVLFLWHQCRARVSQSQTPETAWKIWVINCSHFKGNSKSEELGNAALLLLIFIFMTSSNYKRWEDKPIVLKSDHLLDSRGDRWELKVISFRKFGFAAGIFCSLPHSPCRLSVPALELIFCEVTHSYQLIKSCYWWLSSFIPWSQLTNEKMGSCPFLPRLGGLKIELLYKMFFSWCLSLCEGIRKVVTPGRAKEQKPSYLNEEGQFGNFLLLAAVL